jgi:hypothetical protein
MLSEVEKSFNGLFAGRRIEYSAAHGMWFKPAAILRELEKGNNCLWIDIDCEIRCNVQEIFALGKDKILLRDECHHTKEKLKCNDLIQTGVTWFPIESIEIVRKWKSFCEKSMIEGIKEDIFNLRDQTALYLVMKSENVKRDKMSMSYNTLFFEVDEGLILESQVKIMHWCNQFNSKQALIKRIMFLYPDYFANLFGFQSAASFTLKK